jgi:CBS domain-containing protein
MKEVSWMASDRELRSRRRAGAARLLDDAGRLSSLVSVAGLVGAPVRNQLGAEIGSVDDVVVRWRGEVYPPVTGLIVKVGRRRAWVHATDIESIEPRAVQLSSARLDLRDVERRPDEVALQTDVVDHQMVDVDGVRVFRAADLYLTRLGGQHVLVGADVGLGTLVRRLGPARWRARPTPERVIDWAAIRPFGEPGGPVQVNQTRQELGRLRPGELADLLEDLGRRQREELLDALDTDAAADALEEMEGDELRNLLRELPSRRTAAAVASMQPDEAAEALRGLDDDTRDELLALMPADAVGRLEPLLQYEEASAGGLMTTAIVTVGVDASLAQARAALIEAAADHDTIDGVVVVDHGGAFVSDIGTFDLLLGEPDDRVIDLARGDEAITVAVDADLSTVVDAFVDARRSSVLVLDTDRRPIGRILADDIIDALVGDRGRFRFPRIW